MFSTKEARERRKRAEASAHIWALMRTVQDAEDWLIVALCKKMGEFDPETGKLKESGND